MTTLRWKILTAVVAAPLLAMAGYGIASASIPDNNGVIHGCYQPQSDGHNTALSVIDTAKSHGACPSNQTELDWNQTGPQGPVGPSTGGSAGLDLQIIEASGQSTATAACPSDHPFLFGGGGYDTSNGGVIPGTDTPDTRPSASESETGIANSWTFVANNSANDTVVAYAICGK